MFLEAINKSIKLFYHHKIVFMLKKKLNQENTNQIHNSTANTTFNNRLLCTRVPIILRSTVLLWY